MRRRGATGPSPPAHGYIGERYDDASGLQYLNARYYDPRLAMFIQPDWWEVTEAGVGTNRYSYSFGDPVNGREPTGHVIDTIWDIGSIAYDLGKLGYAGWTNDDELWDEAVVDLAVDSASALVPGLPTGSSKLARATTQVVQKSARGVVGHQTHHIISQKLGKQFKDLFKRTGYDINGQKNLIDFPTDRKYHPTRTVHCGKHCGDYDRLFEDRLRNIEKRLDNGEITPAQARDEIEELRDEVAGQLERGEISLNKRSEAQPPEPREPDKDDHDKTDLPGP